MAVGEGEMMDAAFISLIRHTPDGQPRMWYYSALFYTVPAFPLFHH